ncbi:tol-pal system protein YbgF [Phreatobacter sp.]|uniref:tol-pal system protein YbgF n=1 Tax=Phreatobacter sp. TaxID=1966341 RepID=UPI003F714264
MIGWAKTVCLRLPLATFALAAVILAASPAGAQTAADLLDRIQRLEAQLRSLNGQLEQSQFRVRQLEEQQRRMQADIEFRLNELEGARGGARPAPQRPQQTAPAPGQQRRSDAFDPTQQQGGPGAPRDLGSLPPGSNAAPPPVAAGPDTNRPLDLGQLSGQAANDPTLAPRGTTGAVPPVIAASTPREQYNAAVAFLQSRDYEQAEIALRSFIDAHPRDRMVGDATHQLGEAMFQRRQYREAAEQFLKVSTDYPRSSRAPSSLLRLGQSLNALGEREAACAAYAEFNRKYPRAAQGTRTAVVNEQRRASC